MSQRDGDEQIPTDSEALFFYKQHRHAQQVEAKNGEIYSIAGPGQKATLGPQIKVHHPEDSDGSPRSLSGIAFTLAESQTSKDSNLSRRASFNLDHQVLPSHNTADGFVVPQTITYTLHLTFDGTSVHDMAKDRTILLNDSNSYRKIEEIAESYVKNESAVALASKELIFRHGKCTIVGDGGYEDSQALTSLDDWKDICTVLINLWTSDYHRALQLDIYREYYSLQTKVIGAINFATTKRNEIHSLMQKALDGRRYIPRIDLLRVTSKDMIRQIINEDQLAFSRSDEREAFIQFVEQKAPRLLAMFVYAKLSMKCLKTLLEKGLDDSKYPLQDCHCCHPECEADFYTMVEQQGAFKAAEFGQIGEHQSFGSHTVIPMKFHPKSEDARDMMPEETENDSEREESRAGQDKTAKKKAYCGSGAYSNVYRVKIDPNHHRLSKDRDSIFAVKEFKDRPQKVGADFQQELDFLNELRQYPHPHIVTHLATWTQDERYCMLFPYAQCNLRQYMRRSKFDLSGQENTLWLLDQLRSLADTLRAIHNLQTTGTSASNATLAAPVPGMQKSGWHHDLKPENILYYRDRGSKYGKLCIADFGSGKVHTYRSGSINTGSANGTLTYEPPEAQSEGRTSRPYDVFSLGCVFLELLIWAVCDYRSVKTFTSKRVARRSPGSLVDIVEDDGFWQRTEDGVFTLRKAVTNWIQHLKQQEHHYHEVLGLVMSMLEPDKSRRIKAVNLWNNLDTIYNKKKVDIENSRDGVFPRSTEQSYPPRLSLYPLDRNTPEPIVTRPRRTSNAPLAGRSYLDAHNFTASPLEKSPTSPRDRRPSSASDNMLSAGSRARNVSISSTVGQYGSSVHSGPRSPDLP